MSLLGRSAVDLLGVCLGRAGPAETVPGAALSPNELHFYVSAARVKFRVARCGFIFFANSSFLLSCRHFNNNKKKNDGLPGVRGSVYGRVYYRTAAANTRFKGSLRSSLSPDFLRVLSRLCFVPALVTNNDFPVLKYGSERHRHKLQMRSRFGESLLIPLSQLID